MKYKIPKTRILYKVDGSGQYTYFPQFKGILFWKNIIYNHELETFIENRKIYGFKDIHDAEKYIDCFIALIKLVNSKFALIYEDSIEYPVNQE
jgi:hypothetical protein